MNEETLKRIVNVELGKLNSRLTEKGYKITFGQSVIDQIFNLNTQEEYGARPLKRIIQNICEDFLSEQILLGNIVENEEISLVFEENEIKISKNNDN